MQYFGITGCSSNELINHLCKNFKWYNINMGKTSKNSINYATSANIPPESEAEDEEEQSDED